MQVYKPSLWRPEHTKNPYKGTSKYCNFAIATCEKPPLCTSFQSEADIKGGFFDVPYNLFIDNYVMMIFTLLLNRNFKRSFS